MARNVPDSELQAISRLMIEHADGNDEVVRLLTLSVGRVFKNIAARGDQWLSYYRSAEVSHITDWLQAALVNNEAWLAHTDAKERPRKLMKFASMAQIMQETDKAMVKANQKLLGIKLVDGDEEIVAELESGYYVVRLLTPASLDRESAVMQHCIGNGGYDEKLDDSKFQYLSLRDPSGKPHATVELEKSFDDFWVKQLQGKQNTAPLPKYVVELISYFEQACIWHEYAHQRLSEHDVVMSASGELFSIYDLPHTFESKGLMYLTEKQVTKLPSNLIVNGRLFIDGTPLTHLEGKIHIKGDLIAHEASLQKLSGDIKIDGSLNLSSSDIEFIPDNLEVFDLWIPHCENMKTLPANLTVRSMCSLTGSAITKIPEGTKIGRILLTPSSEITADLLPSTLQDELVLIRGAFLQNITAGEAREKLGKGHEYPYIRPDDAKMQFGMRPSM